MAEKVTIMKLKVDLECEKCYKKVKKVLCKFPQIRDQLFDEKKNTVTIKVVCCSPEKLRDRLCCKGGGSIKAIEIVEPPKPKPEPEKKKEPEKPKPEPEKKKEPGKPKPDPEKKKSPPPEPPREDARRPPPVEMAAKFLEPMPVMVLAYPPPAVPFGPFYESGSDGYGRPIYDSYGGGGHCYMSRHDPHLCQEDVSVCTIA